MKFLLETHTFIWWDSAPTKLPAETFKRLQTPDNQVLLSLASLWEIQIKSQLGKLTLRGDLVDIVQEQQVENNLRLLPIELAHILELQQLPQHHKDPFDRLLIAQSQVEAAMLISRDPMFQSYDCQLMW